MIGTSKGNLRDLSNYPSPPRIEKSQDPKNPPSLKTIATKHQQLIAHSESR